LKLSKREIVLSCFLGFMVIIYFYYRFCLIPLEEETERLRDENQALQMKIQQDEKLIQSHIEYDSAYSLPKESDNMEIAIPSSPCVPEILSFFHISAKENGISISALRYSLLGSVAGQKEKTGPSSNEEGKFQELELSISAKGTYLSLLNFISAIEESPRVFVIKHCKMSRNRVQAAKEAIAQTESQEGKNKSQYQYVSEEEEIPPTPSVQSLQSSTDYEAEDIVLNLSISSFFDQSALPSLAEKKEGNAYSQLQGVRNPFFRAD
jgi:Tfp pilus assembly protein PilO